MLRLPRNPNKQISTDAARTSLRMMLTNARDISMHTPESLARMYRVNLKEIECMLNAEIACRARRGAA